MLEKLFRLQENRTDIRTEVFAGITTFITMSYILIMNPIILSSTGMDMYSVFAATALCAAITTLIMAFSANLPIALAPGMDLNVAFAYIAVAQLGYSWQFALTAFLIEGIIYLVLSFTGFRNSIIKCFPPTIIGAISMGAGLFITLIGLRSSGIIISDESALLRLGDVTSPQSLVTIFGVLVIGIMFMHKVKGALLIGILLSTFLSVPLGVTSFSDFASPTLFSIPSIAPTFMQFEWNHVFSFDMLALVGFFLFIDIFDTTGTFISLASKGKWFDKNGKLPNARAAFASDAIGSILGAVCGTSGVTSYIENASGIVEGGKTGLTSFTVAILFLLSLLIAPVFLFIPIQASSAALIMVGIFMISPVSTIDFTDYLYGIPSFIIIACVPFTNSIADGIVFGLISYVVLAFFSGRKKELSKTAVIVAFLCLAKYIFIG